MPWAAIAAGIAGGSSLLGGFLGGSAAQKAAKLQYQATVDARRTMDDYFGRFVPEMGYEADRQSWQVGDRSRDAVAGVQDALKTGRWDIEGGLKTANDYLNPYKDIGTDSLKSLNEMMQPGGALNKDFTAADMEAYDPGYQFRIDQANKALQTSAAARGGVMGGGTLRALDRQTQGMASSEFGAAFDRFQRQQDARFNRFSSLANLGYNAANTMGGNEMQARNTLAQLGLSGANTMGQFQIQPAEFNANLIYGSRRDMANAGLDTARTVADLYTQGGNAMAAGKMGTANAWSNALGGVANTALRFVPQKK